MDRILELLANWAELTDDERAELTDLLGTLPDLDDDALGQVETALVAIADEIAGTDTPDDQALEALEFIADRVEAVRAEATSRATAEADRRQRAQDLRDRIMAADDSGEDDTEDAATDEAGDGDEAENGDNGEGDGDDGEGSGDGTEQESSDTAVPVAASTPTRVGRVAARRPAAARPNPAPSRQSAPLVASANVPGVPMGHRLDTPQRFGQAVASTLTAMAGMQMKPGMVIPVAHAEIEYPDGSFLDHNVRGNEAKLDAAVGTQVVTAAGGICAPAPPRYDLPSLGTDARPVRDSLARFGFDRGGAILPTIPTILDVDEAVSVWTIEDDVDAVTDPDVRKPCMRVVCDEGATVRGYAVPWCLEIGNWDARTWPERIQKFKDLVQTWHARFADSRLLTLMGAASTQVTYDQVLGTARDVLTALDLATAAMRNRWRMPVAQPLHFQAPETLRSQIRADLVRELPGSTDERLAVADATIDGFFAARRVNVTWFLDGEAGQIFGTQGDGALLGWDPVVITYLYPEGHFLFLDGGTLDFGLTRDSTLNARNDFQLQSETFEGLAPYGVEALRLALTVCPNGQTSGTADLVCPDTATS